MARAKQIMVGLPSDAPNYPDGTSIIMVAKANEFGTSRISERSFLRKSVYRHHAKYAKMLRKAIHLIVRGKDEDKQLNLIGLAASQDVKKQIDETLTPPNSPETIRRKGSSHPLIDTGHLRQQITWALRRRRKLK